MAINSLSRSLILAIAFFSASSFAHTDSQTVRLAKRVASDATLQIRAANDTLSFLEDEDDEALPEFYYEDGLDENYVAPEGEENLWKRAMGPTWSSPPTIALSKVKAGVGAMQITITGPDSVLIIDKAENNPLKINSGKKHPAWVQWLNYKTGKYQILDAQTNTFCGGGAWLSNGSMVSVGGNARVNAASYYNGNGVMGVRVFEPCNNNGCKLGEWPHRVRMSSARWYPSATRLSDGSLLVMGGMTAGGFNNVKATDNPTYEYYPSKSQNNGMPIHSKFLADALLSNLFPIAYILPSGRLFVAANTRAMIFNPQTNVELRLPNIPNGVRCTYPFTAAATLLPLTVANDWTPEILICGGSTINENIKAHDMSSQTPASKQCVRKILNNANFQRAWEIEQMPAARIMGEAVLTPDGKVIIVNGARTGLAGYGNVGDVIGQSNADNPDYSPLVYDPLLNRGKRFSTLRMPVSKIARMYHSVASMTADGSILIAGSNPNDDVRTKTYATEYRIEMLSPAYTKQPRPTLGGVPKNILFGKTSTVTVKWPAGTAQKDISIVLMDFGYRTHGVAVDQRLVELKITKVTKTGRVTFENPSNGNMYPPGIGWIFVVTKGVPSIGQRIMVGTGADPPFDAKANAYMLAHTKEVKGIGREDLA